MHTTWLVRDTSAFWKNPGPTSDLDQLLSFGLTYKEWIAIYFKVLKIGGEYEGGNIRIGEFDPDDPALAAFPLLGRIHGMLHDAVFETTELDQLRDECIRVRDKAQDSTALRGIEKLLKMCDLAKPSGLSICLMSD